MSGNLGVNANVFSIPWGNTDEPAPKSVSLSRVQKPSGIHVSENAQVNIAKVLKDHMTVSPSQSDVGSDFYVADQLSSKISFINFRSAPGVSDTESAVKFVEEQVALFHSNPPKAVLN
jgi:hypothetical protein